MIEDCKTGKTIFQTLNSAKRAGTYCTSNRRLRAYYCSECGGYHLTTSPERIETHEIRKSAMKFNRDKVEREWNRFKATLSSTGIKESWTKITYYVAE